MRTILDYWQDFVRVTGAEVSESDYRFIFLQEKINEKQHNNLMGTRMLRVDDKVADLLKTWYTDAHHTTTYASFSPEIVAMDCTRRIGHLWAVALRLAADRKQTTAT